MPAPDSIYLLPPLTPTHLAPDRPTQIVPPNLGYPASDPSHTRVGPRPSTFSGQRALDFVLENKELIDKTLLFNVKLIRVDAKGAGRG